MMYTILTKLFLFSFFLFSCAPKNDAEEVVPETLLTEEQLVNVLTDAYLAEGASGINVKNVPGEKFDSVYIFNPLKDNNIDKIKFDSTMAYFTRHPKKLKVIYDKVLEKMSLAQAKGKVE